MPKVTPQLAASGAESAVDDGFVVNRVGRANQIVTTTMVDADVSCTPSLRTTLVGVVIHMCRRHAAPTQAQVRLH